MNKEKEIKKLDKKINRLNKRISMLDSLIYDGIIEQILVAFGYLFGVGGFLTSIPMFIDKIIWAAILFIGVGILGGGMIASAFAFLPDKSMSRRIDKMQAKVDELQKVKDDILGIDEEKIRSQIDEIIKELNVELFVVDKKDKKKVQKAKSLLVQVKNKGTKQTNRPVSSRAARKAKQEEVVDSLY